MSPGLIYQRLIKDGYNIFGDKNYNQYFHAGLTSFGLKVVPSLKTQSLIYIYENKYLFYRNHELVISRQNLPVILFKYINDFYKGMNTRKLFELDNGDFCVN